MKALHIKTLSDQYALVKASRVVLLDYCATINPDHFLPITVQRDVGAYTTCSLTLPIPTNFGLENSFLEKKITTSHIPTPPLSKH